MKRLLLLICTLLCANVLMAQTRFWIDSLQYEVTSTNPAKVKVYDANSSITTAIIPAIVTYNETTYSVTSIEEWAFYNCSSLTSVTIPNSVTSIGEMAFVYCTSLTSVVIPNSVTSIGGAVFYNCISLTSVTLSNNITELPPCDFDGYYYGFFEDCSSLTSVTIPNSVTSIGNYVFYGCSSLTSIDIPNSVTSIGEGAFVSCSSLTSVDIPNSVTSIGEEAFASCSSLTSVTIPNSVTSIRYGAFASCSSLTSVTIGNGVTSIGSLAFSNCRSLTSVTIGNGVTSIGYRAFQSCSSLTSVTIPNSVTSIGEYAFRECSSLNSVTFGESLAEIAIGAFNDCFFLQNVTCLATTPPTLADNTVFPYPNIATLTIPCGTLEAYSAPTSFWNMFFMGRISERGYNVEVSVNDETFGSVAVESDCSTGTLTATANEGYRFVIWNDGNTDNPRTVALTSDTAFTAIFALIDESSLLEAETESISFFPNPTKSKITFSQAIEKVEIIDLTGKAILTFTNAKTINVESLPAGAYYLRLTNNDKAIIQKVIKE